MNANGELRLIEIATPDNGTEVLWVEKLGSIIRVVSVPVFAEGISRDALVLAEETKGQRLRFRQVLQPSAGATIRCYVAESLKASKVYTDRIYLDAERLGLRIGPATFFDPEVVAFHVKARDQVSSVFAYLDTLAHERVIRIVELGDPPMQDLEQPPEDGGADEPWELVHPLPVDRTTNHVKMD